MLGVDGIAEGGVRPCDDSPNTNAHAMPPDGTT